MNQEFYVYILTNLNKTVLYTGVTNHLKKRIIEHYQSRGENITFSGRYRTFYLLYFEVFRYIDKAIKREKEIKGWRREKKINLIKTKNPSMEFLNVQLFGEWPPFLPGHVK